MKILPDDYLLFYKKTKLIKKVSRGLKANKVITTHIKSN